MSVPKNEKPKHENRLIYEKSPYLLQHAHNPVDWYPWGDDAFERAKTEDKPVFLSIGYSTCHWCHVMEYESFEDERVAEELNKNFISIKADREERPDVDSFYMNACMTLNGSGGWPLSCFLTPDRKPFFAGTYFPKDDAYGRAGFLTLLRRIADMWRDKRDEVSAAAAGLLGHVSAGEKRGAFPEKADDEAYAELCRSFDGVNGGFGGAPKFPSLPTLLFLMRYGLAKNEAGAFDMVRITLERMRRGGIYDAVGGGFFRYSTDGRWLVPHFEKMLYDNALHIYAYSEAGAFLEKSFERTVRETAEFVLRDLHDIRGGFYTALDADSGGGEGRYYLWSPRDVGEALGSADGTRYCALYGVAAHGNFEGRSIPNLLKQALPSDEDRNFTASANRRLLEYRDRRSRPFRDDKVLTANNGLMIAALACAGRIFKEKTYIGHARKCADFILQNLFSGERLLARWRAGEAGVPAGCGDYAFLIWGLIELYEATFEPCWLEQALRLTDSAGRLFWDRAQGGYYLSGSDMGDLPLRQKEYYDGALPSANSVMAQNLIRLSRLTGDPGFETRAAAVFDSAADGVGRYPAAYCGLLCAFEHAKAGGSELVIANGEGVEKMFLALPRFAPFHVTAVCGAGYEKMAELAPFTQDDEAINGRAAAYLCIGGACLPPMTDPSALRERLERKAAVS